MKDGMAALAQDNETGLNGVCPMKDLFRRMAHDHIRFEFNPLFPGAFPDGNETALVALTPVIEDRMKLRALGGFRRTDHSQDEQLGFHIPRHRQGHIQSVLRMWRRVEGHQYPLKSNKNRDSHGLDLYLSCSGCTLHCLI